MSGLLMTDSGCDALGDLFDTDMDKACPLTCRNSELSLALERLVLMTPQLIKLGRLLIALCPCEGSRHFRDTDILIG